MKKRFVTIFSLISIMCFAQNSEQKIKLSAELSYPIVVDKQYFKSYIGYADLGIVLSVLSKNDIDYGLRINSSFYSNEMKDVVYKDIPEVQYKIKATTLLLQPKLFTRYTGLNRITAEIGFGLSILLNDQEVNDKNVTIEGVNNDIGISSYMSMNYHFSKSVSAFLMYDLTFLESEDQSESNNINLVKIGLGYRLIK